MMNLAADLGIKDEELKDWERNPYKVLLRKIEAMARIVVSDVRGDTLEDITQDVALAVMEMGGIPGVLKRCESGKFWPYLSGIVENKALKNLKSLGRMERDYTVYERTHSPMPRQNGKWISEEEAAPGRSILEQLQSDEFLKALRRKLPRALRRAFTEVYIEGRSLREASKKLGIPADILKVTLWRAKKKWLTRAVEKMGL